MGIGRGDGEWLCSWNGMEIRYYSKWHHLGRLALLSLIALVSQFCKSIHHSNEIRANMVIKM